MPDINSELNRMNRRISQLEQQSMVSTPGAASVSYNQATKVTTVDDKINWSTALGKWEPWSSISPLVYNQTTGARTGGGVLSTAYGRPEAHLLGSMCMLTGVVRRKGVALQPGQRLSEPLFGLPENWRPTTSIILPCAIGNSNPASDVVSQGWIEIRSGLSPLAGSGVVYYIGGATTLSPNTGWIALQGLFPSYKLDIST